VPTPLEFIPANAIKFTDGATHGGNPNVAPPPAPKAPPEVKPPPPAPEPTKVETPEPVKPKDTPKPKEPDTKPAHDEPDFTKPKVKETAHKPTHTISTNVVKRSKVDVAAIRAEKEARRQAEEDARAYEQYRHSLASAASKVGTAVSGLGSSLSATPVSIDGYGPGGGGPLVANWRAAIFSVYARAWAPPQDAQGSAKGEAKIVIARDGTVLSARLLKPSGDSAVDRSIIRVLNEVKSVPPFPEEAREEERTVRIIFDLNAKRALG
jgi:TonB family protein